MKKIIILFLSLFILFSCNKQIDNNETSLGIIEQTGSVVSQSGELLEEAQFSEEPIEDSTKNELINITHENFKPLIESLKSMDKDSLKDIDCNNYLYFPELDKRPEFQVEIYNDYIKQCNEIVDNSNK